MIVVSRLSPQGRGTSIIGARRHHMPLKLRRRTRRGDLDLEDVIAAQIAIGRAVNLALAEAIERIERQDRAVTR